MKWTIRKKIMTAFLGLTAVLFFTNSAGINNLFNANTQLNEVAYRWMPNVINLEKLSTDVVDSQRMLMAYATQIDPTHQEEIETAIQESVAKTSEDWNRYASLMTTDEEKQLYKQFSANWKTYQQSVDETIAAVKANQPEQLQAAMSSSHTAFEQARPILEKLIEINEKNAEAAKEAAVQTSENGQKMAPIFAFIGLLAAIILGYLLSGYLTRPIVKVAKRVELVAAGDFTLEPLEIRSKDEIGLLTKDFNQMTAHLREMIQQVANRAQDVTATSEELTASSSQTAYATGEISKSVQEVADGAEYQMESVNGSNQAMKKILKSMHDISVSMGQVADSSQLATEKATSGNEVITKVRNQMTALSTHSTETEEVVNALGEKSQAIFGIVEAINGIAEQTNLLALNAAIEAARAGEHGKGFSVVADEVRKLAEQSQRETTRIQTIIDGIRQDIDRAVHSTQEGKGFIAEGLAITDMAGIAFREILSAIQHLNGQAAEVAATIEHAHASTEEMGASMERVVSISKQAKNNTLTIVSSVEEQTASMAEVAKAADNLSAMAEQLYALIHRFKV
ncbi:methyl-accepting chemotaxis protein [Brevibacillus fulvus]|uniref:Methyl-accepting chemotaxis protein n=1 Tax=Brevibacillus fulvus TaxID=1125967 RepID=A0A938Y0R3_9BACL|nr:methyl-accepting chemotaxis protein [Brevibacillus fulvus]MBM7591236.1 methyl-accepting chemotaxis protein [Brevibacillus fulvus]